MKTEGVLDRHALGEKERRVRPGTASRRAAQEIILLCTTAIISPEVRARLSQILTKPIDWQYFLELVVFQGMVPLVAHNLVANGLSSEVPQSYRDQLKHGYHSTVYRNVVLSSHLVDVLSTFSRHGIKTITLKGTVLAEVLYGNPCLRTVTDIDILVHPGDIPLARTLLATLYYKETAPEQAWRYPFHGAPYRKDGNFPVFLELHWALDDNKFVVFPEDEIWRRAQPLQLQGVSTLVLSPEDNLLFMANHLSKNDFHLLKFLGDIAELLKKYEASLNWDYITKSAQSIQMEPALYYALRRAKELLRAPVPTSSLETLRLGAWRWWLLDFLVGQETFVSPIRWNKLRSETSALVRSLMMKHPREMLAVLSNHRGSWKRGARLRTAFWIVLVFIAGLGRYCTRFVAKRGLTVW